MNPDLYGKNTNSTFLEQPFAAEMAGIVLAGGLSTRMRKDKASLPWKESDFLNQVLSRLAPVCRELIVVSNVYRNITLPNVRIVPDNYTFCGPLAGMQAGIYASNYDYNFIAACDMPFLNTQTVEYIGLSAIGYDAAVPFVDGYFNPLHGVYHRTCLTYIEELLEQGNYRILDFYNMIRLRYISVDELKQFDKELKTLTNINTPEDLRCKGVV